MLVSSLAEVWNWLLFKTAYLKLDLKKCISSSYLNYIFSGYTLQVMPLAN